MVPPGQCTGNNWEWEVVGLCRDALAFVNSIVTEDRDKNLVKGESPLTSLPRFHSA